MRPRVALPQGGLDGSATWFLGYHALTCLDYDLGGDFERWVPPAPFDENTYAFPNRVFTRAELLGYVDWCRGRARQSCEALTDEWLSGRCQARIDTRDPHTERSSPASRYTSLNTPRRSASSSPAQASGCNQCPATAITRDRSQPSCKCAALSRGSVSPVNGIEVPLPSGHQDSDQRRPIALTSCPNWRSGWSGCREHVGSERALRDGTKHVSGGWRL